MIGASRPSRRPAVFLLATLALTALVSGQQAQRQQQDEDFAREVREWTTRPEFLGPLVDHLPKTPGVPSPKDVLGYHVGSPKKLTYYADVVGYYRALAAKSPRVRVFAIGRTDEGRDSVVVAVGSEESIRNLEQYRRDLAELADPRGLTEAQAMEIVAKAKPIYHLMGGLHSAETGPPEMLMELADRLATEDSPLIDRIRDNVIVTITPVAEPDGRDRYVDWYYAYKVDETGEDDSRGGPPYWGKYVLHDNNRDINYSQVTMRALLKWYLEWHPPIMHDLHESVPFLYTFSGQAPQNPTLDPILYGEMPWFANFEMAQMTKYGMPGVWTHAFVDMWSPGYLGFMASNHNGLIRMYEVFGNGGANTMKRRVERPEAEGGGRGGSQTTREWYRPLPAYKEVEWSMRNTVNYAETAVLSALQLTAAFPREVLDNFYRKSRNSIEAGRTQAPHGYVIGGGGDPTRDALVVNLLRLQGVEVGKTTAEVKVKDGTFAAGSYVVKLDQPYGRLAKILLEKQNFPDPNLRTYDDTAWTMGLMAGVPVKAIDDKAILEAKVEPVAEVELHGTVAASQSSSTGSPSAVGSGFSRIGPSAVGSGLNPIEGVAYLVAHHGSPNMTALRYRLKDVKVEALERDWKGATGRDYPAGSFVIPLDQGGADVRDLVREAIEPLGLAAESEPAMPTVPVHDLDLPRLAVFSTWGSTQEVGWVRYAFDKFEVAYDLIYKERVRQGNLRAAYDVILIPSQGGSGKRLVFDVEPKKVPLAYKRTERFKNLGMYGESDDITGGMGLEGVVELQKFVNEGGVLITLGAASFFPAEFGLARRLEASRPSGQFYAPGPIVEAEILRPASPIFYGYTGDDSQVAAVDTGLKPRATGETTTPDPGLTPRATGEAATRDRAQSPRAATGKTIPVRYAGGPLLRLPDQDKDQVLMQFRGGDAAVLSGLMRGANEVRNRPAIVDIPTGKGRIVVFATNPCYRWQNFGEFNLLFNAVLNFDDR
jgi:hypothetical protein